MHYFLESKKNKHNKAAEEARDHVCLNLIINGGQKTFEDLDKLYEQNMSLFMDLYNWYKKLPLQRTHVANPRTMAQAINPELREKLALAHGFFNAKLYKENPNYGLYDLLSEKEKGNEEHNNIIWYRKKDNYDRSQVPSKDYTVVVGHNVQMTKIEPNGDYEHLTWKNEQGDDVTVICVDGGAYRGEMYKYDGSFNQTYSLEHHDTSPKEDFSTSSANKTDNQSEEDINKTMYFHYFGETENKSQQDNNEGLASKSHKNETTTQSFTWHKDEYVSPVHKSEISPKPEEPESKSHKNETTTTQSFTWHKDEYVPPVHKSETINPSPRKSNDSKPVSTPVVNETEFAKGIEAFETGRRVNLETASLEFKQGYIYAYDTYKKQVEELNAKKASDDYLRGMQAFYNHISSTTYNNESDEFRRGYNDEKLKVYYNITINGANQGSSRK